MPPRKKKNFNPDKVLHSRLSWQRGYRQVIEKQALKAYIIKYGPEIKTYSEKPTIFNFWKVEEKIRPLVIKPIQYTGLLKVSVYWVGEGRKHKEEEELNRIVGVSEED